MKITIDTETGIMLIEDKDDNLCEMIGLIEEIFYKYSKFTNEETICLKISDD